MAASTFIDVLASSDAASLQHRLNALAYTERADKEAITNWKRRIQGEMGDDYEYRQEGDAPSIVVSALRHEEQMRELTLAPAAPATPVVVSNATGLVDAGNDTVDDGGGEQEDDKLMGESSEVLLLTPRHIGATVGGVGGRVSGPGHQLPFRNHNPPLVFFSGNEVLPASAGPSLLVQALSAMHGDQGIFTNSHIQSPLVVPLAQPNAQLITTPSVWTHGTAWSIWI